MATLKQRVHRMNSSGSYDTIYYETSSEVVIRPDGTTVESAINSIVESSASISDIGNLWMWKKYSYVPASYSLGARHTTPGPYLWAGNSNQFSSMYPIVYQISNSISVAPDGTISLVNPTNCSVYKTGYTTYAGADSIKGKFFKYVKSLSWDGVSCSFAAGVIYYLPSDGRFNTPSGSGYLYVNFHQLVTGTSEKEMSVASGLIEVVTNKNETAYPSDDRSGDYWYTRLGQIGDAFELPEVSEGVAKTETGSYVGTGTYGSDNPNSLTFSFKPKIIFITSPNGSSDSGQYFSNLMAIDGNFYPYMDGFVIDGYFKTYGGQMKLAGYMKINGNTITWYETTSAYDQANARGLTYSYFVIG